MLENLLFVFVGLVGLFVGGEWLVTGSSRLARSWGISSLVIGLTVVAFGTSSPELLVSLQAALAESSDIAIGNIIGSNIANIGLILGATALVFPIKVRSAMIYREIPILIAVTLITALIVSDGMVSRLDGAILTVGLIVFNLVMIMFARRDFARNALSTQEIDLKTDVTLQPVNRKREVLRCMLGLAILLGGAQLTVNGSVAVAVELGVSQLVIGITLVALGTSLPELATSLIAAFRKQSDIAIGNVVGSNVYNLLCVLGITGLVRPFPVAQEAAVFDGPVMILFTLALLPLVLNRMITRLEATLLLIAYFAFIFYTVWH